MSIKHNLEQWIAQLDYDDTCDISDRQVSELIRGYSALEAKCAALAAENAGLNEKMNKLATWPGIEFYSSAWEFNGGDGDTALEFMCDVQTPSTDAFLAEVRAQGVEMVIAYHRERADALHHVDRNNAIRHSMAALDASDVATQLRQEAAQ